MVKKTLYFVGSSHAKRLCQEAYKVEKIKNNYYVRDFSRPGSLFENLVWPERSTLDKDDIIIFQSFGNNILQKHIEREGGKIHLTKFVPNKFSYLEKIFNQLIQKVKNLPCKVYIFDNIYRHLNCCKKHHYKGLAGFQQTINLKLQKILKPVPNITVLDHRRFLGFNFRKIWKISKYNKILSQDGVHLNPILYNKMVLIFSERFCHWTHAFN